MVESEMIMEFDPQSGFDELIQSMDNLIQTERFEDMKKCLHSYQSMKILGDNLAFFVQWVSQVISNRGSSPPDTVTSILTDYLGKMPEIFEVSESLLILSSKAHSLRCHPTFCLWLNPIARCIRCLKQLHIRRVTSIFTDVTVALSCLSTKALKSKNFKALQQTLDGALEVYTAVLEKLSLAALECTDANLLKEHILFLFAQPLSVLDFTPEYSSLYSRSLYLLNILSGGLYSYYCFTVDHLRSYYINRSVEIHLTVPAWFQLLAFVHLEAERNDLNNCWPLVFPSSHYINLFHEFIVILLDDTCEKALVDTPKTSHIPSLSKDIYLHIKVRVIETLDRLISLFNLPLTVSWWDPRRMQYLDLLKAISKQSVSTEELPDVINKAICCIDKLIRRSSYTAQCQLFYELLPPKVNEHHGLRGHLITLCKDSLHGCWVSITNSGIQEVIKSEAVIGELHPQLPIERNVLACLCEMIFIYPNTHSTDALVDQSSWILAAANMALYFFLRYEAIIEKNGCSTVVDDIMNALLRTADGKSKFVTKFLHPLKNELDAECLRVQTNKNVLSNDIEKAGDRRQKEQHRSNLAAQEATLLRLHLLQVTIQRLFDYCDKLSVSQ